MMQKFLLVLFFSLSLISCTPVQVTPVNRYMIDKIPCGCRSVYSRTHATLGVALPESSVFYNTTAMAYTICPYQIDYFVRNQWAEPPAQMLQPLMAQALRNTHYFRTVSTSDYGRYDLILNSQLLELIQVFRCNGCSYVSLKIHVELVDGITNEVIRSKMFCLTEPAPCPTPYGGVIAANRAAMRLMEQLAMFVRYR